MRIRSIKPEFWRSPDISCLAIEDRLLFVGLWSYVDDNGVGEDREAMISADLFADDLARDPRETFARVSRGLSKLSEAGRIVRYTVARRDFLEITNWSKHQRIDKPGKARLPHHHAAGAVIREGVASLPETLAPGTGDQGTGEQGNREQGTGSEGSADAPLSPFCSTHPKGTEKPCRPCGTARAAYELAKSSQKSKPSAQPFTVAPGSVCAGGNHQLIPDGTCTRCEYRAEAA